MKKITILFGEMGAGKSYLGRKLAMLRGVPFVEGDAYMTKEMSEAVKKFKPLSKDMLGTYVKISLADAIKRETDKSRRGIVVSQALYTNELRRSLRAILEVWGFDVELLHVRVPFFQNIKQLWSRENGFRWVMYFLASHFFFEKPNHTHVAVKDVEQLKLFASWSK